MTEKVIYSANPQDLTSMLNILEADLISSLQMSLDNMRLYEGEPIPHPEIVRRNEAISKLQDAIAAGVPENFRDTKDQAAGAAWFLNEKLQAALREIKEFIEKY